MIEGTHNDYRSQQEITEEARKAIHETTESLDDRIDAKIGAAEAMKNLDEEQEYRQAVVDINSVLDREIKRKEDDQEKAA